MSTGIGGGIARDVLLAEIPSVLRSDLYAVAALVGAAIMVIATCFSFRPESRLLSERRSVSDSRPGEWARLAASGCRSGQVTFQRPDKAGERNRRKWSRLTFCPGDK
jgi:hypothetical protein